MTTRIVITEQYDPEDGERIRTRDVLTGSGGTHHVASIRSLMADREEALDELERLIAPLGFDARLAIECAASWYAGACEREMVALVLDALGQSTREPFNLVLVDENTTVPPRKHTPRRPAPPWRWRRSPLVWLMAASVVSLATLAGAGRHPSRRRRVAASVPSAAFHAYVAWLWFRRARR